MNKLGAAVFILIFGGVLGLFAMNLRPDTFWAGVAGLVLTAIFVLMVTFGKSNPNPRGKNTYYQAPHRDEEWTERQGLYHDVREMRRNSK